MTLIEIVIRLSDQQYEGIRLQAGLDGITLDEAVARVLEAGLRACSWEPGHRDPPTLLDLAGLEDGGLSDLGREHDHYLDDEFLPTD